MKKPEIISINDTLFQQGISCPLKLFHYREERKFSALPYKQRNKLRLRDAVAFQYENLKFTSDNTKTAAGETKKWLKEPNVTVCGAVIESDGCHTRIPILRKQKNHFSVIQIHGKLRKRSQFKAIRKTGVNRVTDIYLLKAAYRCEILKRCFPDSEVSVRFFFPEREFKASVDKLLQKADRNNIVDEQTGEELKRLFASVDATEGVEDVSSSIPGSVAYPEFENSTVSEALEKIINKLSIPATDYGVSIHKGCRECNYRKPAETGCWTQFFDQKEILKPGQHVFELIGHGNNVEADSGFFYQEEVPVHDAFQTFEAVQKTGGKAITIQQRRLLQLLKAKGAAVPMVWAKPGIEVLKTLQYPLHFIDFEAATYPLPMNRNGSAYDPVYFQFSCHTLYKNGELNHTEWLDADPEEGYPHKNFVKELANVNDIFEGTFVQYSPFEGQALNYLYREFGRNAMLHQKEISILEKLRAFHVKRMSPRFFDLSKLIRDFYFNSFFNGGLGLKQVLTGILGWEKQNSSERKRNVSISNMNIDLFSSGGENIPDPYHEIQHEGYKIGDGAEAMNAYISLKSKNLSEEETKIIPALLKRYCTLDTYALIIIFQHLEQLCKKTKRDEDLIIF